MTTPELKLSIEVFIDRKSNKVIFAEAGSDFVDVLFSFLTLPLGTIIRQLNTHCGKHTKALGCLTNFYVSVSNLSNSGFFNDRAMSMLLRPTNASEFDCKKLRLKIDDSQPFTNYYKCQDLACKYREVMYTSPYAACLCGRITSSFWRAMSSTKGVFADAAKSFVITDDLRVWNIVDGSNLELIQGLVNDDHIPEQKTLKIGLKEIMHLLKWSLLSKTPLTNLLHWKLNSDHFKPHCDYGSVSCKQEIVYKTKDSKKMIVKAVVQKSTNKLLYFVTGVDFIEFLFRLLTIPLGSTVSLFGGKTDLWSIDKLHKSISELSSDCFISPKSLLVNPKVAHRISYSSIQFLSLTKNPGLLLMGLMGDKGLIKSPSMFMVTDNLEVTPLSCASIISHLCARNIPISDVQESVLKIGTKEALDILNASLTSSASALSNALWP